MAARHYCNYNIIKEYLKNEVEENNCQIICKNYS